MVHPILERGRTGGPLQGDARGRKRGAWYGGDELSTSATRKHPERWLGCTVASQYTPRREVRPVLKILIVGLEYSVERGEYPLESGGVDSLRAGHVAREEQ